MVNKETLLSKIDLNRDLPECAKAKLKETIFTEPSLFGVFAAALGLATPVMWLQTHDKWIVTFAAFATIVLISRMVLGFLFARLYRRNGAPSLTTCVAVLGVTIGAIFVPTVAALAIRAAYLKEVASIDIAAIMVAGYVVGSVSRGAGAFPEVTILLAFLLFAPLITAAMAVGTLAYSFIGLILAYFFIATVRLTLVVHGRMKAQLLAEYRLSMVARTDHLTGLANRAGFEERGLHALESSRSTQTGCAVAVIDLDGFKAVNDAHGHGAGDSLLKEVALRIKETLGAKHFPARLGGDEFAVLFDPDTSLDEAIAIGKNIVTALKLPYTIGAAWLDISGSMGLACFENEADTFASIVERADKALYRAKRSGKNQVQPLRAAAPTSSFGPELDHGGVPIMKNVAA